MHLRRLDLVGFKSFANRTTFLFEPGISVMCGPNGSGKSNVADAVRWALGEQNARAVRGRRGEDVIFVGSQGRQPLGLAEVSLTLDNSDGRIPLDYQEVKITRRLYRSGDAEYLVNGAKVRLKDIHQWLLHAALDAEAYVVVGQGSVDQLILQRPEERRVVIDNAADIRRHQTRLQETRTRLAGTEENLLRCRAVIAELEPHVSRLKAQAERAQRAQVLREELSGLAGRWLRHALAGARSELAKARADAAEARTRAERQDAEVADLEVLARAADRDALAAETTVSELEPRLSVARDEAARIARDLVRAEERLAGADDAEARVLRDLEQQREREGALKAEQATLATRLEAARVALADAERAVREATDAGRAEEEQTRQAEVALSAARQRAAALDGGLRSASAAVEEARVRIDRVERRRARLAEDIERLTVDLERARAAAASRTHAAAGAADALVAARQARDSLQAERDDARAAVDRLRAEQHRLAGSRQRLEIARQAANEAAAGQKGSGRDLVLKSGIAGVRGLLGGELRVPERLQAAIAAALGERAQALLVSGQTSAESAVQMILKRVAERTGLMVLFDGATKPDQKNGQDHDGGNRRVNGDGADNSDEMHRAPTWAPFAGARFVAPDSIIASRKPATVTTDRREIVTGLLAGLAVVGFADELVESAPDLSHSVQRVLGTTVIVEDLATASEAVHRLESALNGNGAWQVATLDGVVIRSTGEWWAGRDRQAERLVRRREDLAAAEQELATVQASLTETEGRLAEAETRINRLAGQERGVRDALTAAESADRKAALDAQAAVAHASRLDRELRDAHTAGPAIDIELQRAVTQRERSEVQRQEAERRRLEGIEAVRQAEAQTSSLTARLSESRAARATAQATLAQCRAEAEGVAALLARLVRDLEGAQRAVAEGERRVEGERQRRADLGSAATNLRAALTVAEAAVEPIAAALTTAREARQQARVKREAIEQRAGELRAIARSGRTVLEATAIAESRATDRLERVRREAQEYVDDLAGTGGSVQLRLNLDDDSVPAQAPEPEDALPFDSEAARRRMGTLRRELRAIGDIGEATLAEFRELSERHRFLVEQTADLEMAGDELRKVMDELTVLMRDAFDTAFATVNQAFGEYFARLFAGGHAELVLSRPDDVLDSGVDIVARPPGKRLQPLVSLSGGERAMTMVALIFALLKTNPAPFCVLDEVDAALDESNVRRFTSVLTELSDRTQFVVVSHNRATMESAKALYGISMDTVGVSTVVSLKLPAEGAPKLGSPDQPQHEANDGAEPPAERASPHIMHATNGSSST
jgi:chromosome segregation protein